MQYAKALEQLLQLPPYQLSAPEKQANLREIFLSLHNMHMAHCPAYRKIFQNIPIDRIQSLPDFPFLAVRLFKLFELSSISQDDIFKVVYSSGTSGQAPAKIYLDRDTSTRQSKTLVKILQSFLGKQRLPMLIIDTPSVLKADGTYSARAAGIQGLSLFAREKCFVLDDDMQLNKSKLKAFVERYREQPVLLFGFTFMVWQYFLQAIDNDDELNLPQGLLLHSGGWKKLEAEKVSNEDFKRCAFERIGLKAVHNFYGMAEQTGTIFVECEQGYLHTPNMADVIIRDPESLDELGESETGIIQVLSVLPTSYPGQSLLTEDLGQIHGEDNCLCGRKGKYFSVHGRLPKTEVRGCSDTHT
ncbi:MAG: acyl-protein synthetase [Aestuariibacter sp.]